MRTVNRMHKGGSECVFSQNFGSYVDRFIFSSNRVWPRQKENTRMVFIKRAQVYHAGRAYMHALYRRRSPLDDALLRDLVEMSLSPYTRARR